MEKDCYQLDSSLQEHAHKFRARRQELLILSDGYRRQQQLLDIKQNRFIPFTKALCSKLLDRFIGFGKEYLKLLVSKICFNFNQADKTGSYSALTHAIDESKMDSVNRVSKIVPNHSPNRISPVTGLSSSLRF